MNCMLGQIHGGKCNRCGKPEQSADDKNPDALAAGSALCGGLYTLGNVLGAGGFGKTYIAWDRRNNHRVAVKELFPKDLVSRAGDGMNIQVKPGCEDFFSHVCQRFEEEAQTLYTLRKSPEITDVYSRFRENGTVYYVMEYLEGINFHTHLNQCSKMTWQQLTPFCISVLRALRDLHAAGLIHRDISPDNIFILRNGAVKLIDFGNARSYSNNIPLTAIVKTKYSPPEQFGIRDKDRQGPWTDIYSLCVTLYVALAGFIPPASQTRIAECAGSGDPLRPIRTYAPYVPEHVEAALMKGMQLDYKNRQQNVAELAAELFPGQAVFPGEVQQKQYHSGRKAVCVRGMRKDSVVAITENVVSEIGRRQSCVVVYPADDTSISRRQCCFTMVRGVVYVMDTSTYGTYVNGARIPASTWVTCPPGTAISFAGEEYRIY